MVSCVTHLIEYHGTSWTLILDQGVNIRGTDSRVRPNLARYGLARFGQHGVHIDMFLKLVRTNLFGAYWTMSIHLTCRRYFRWLIIIILSPLSILFHPHSRNEFIFILKFLKTFISIQWISSICLILDNRKKYLFIKVCFKLIRSIDLKYKIWNSLYMRS